MSTTTPNLTLTLYDSTTDQVVTFATFRAVWGGTATTSNFYRIDTWAGTVNSAITTLQNQRGSIPVSAAYVSANYYEATVASITSYITGMTILLKLDTDSAGTVTLNINALGTKSVTKVNSSGSIVNIAGGELQSNRWYLFTYDGTQWVWVDANSSDQVYVTGGTSGNVITVAADNSLDGTLTQSLLLSQTINSATGKTTPVDADSFGLVDSASSNVLKKVTWANIKATLASIFSPFLANTSVTVTTSNVTATENTVYNLTIAGLTANRNFVLPTPSDVGKTITVNILDGDDTYFIVIIGDTSVTINGQSSATEFLRIQTKGRSLTFRSNSGTNWQCVSGGEEIEKNAIVVDTLQPMSAAGTIASGIGRPFRITQINISYFINGTNNGSNYWNVAITNALGTTVATTVNTSTGSPTTWSQLPAITTFSQQNLNTSDVYLKIVPSIGAGTPGSAYFLITVTGILG